MKAGKFTWTNPANGATYSENINNTTPGNIAAANNRAATALSTTVDLLTLSDNHGRPFGGAGRQGHLRS